MLRENACLDNLSVTQPGGRALISTISCASCTGVSFLFGPWSGDRGSAIKPASVQREVLVSIKVYIERRKKMDALAIKFARCRSEVYFYCRPRYTGSEMAVEEEKKSYLSLRIPIYRMER